MTGQHVSARVEIEVRGYEIYVEIDGYYNSGGSSCWGSDEPPWEEIEDINVCSVKTGKEVSDRLYDYLIRNVDLGEILLDNL